jgi:hypothetical protein
MDGMVAKARPAVNGFWGSLSRQSGGVAYFLGELRDFAAI